VPMLHGSAELSIPAGTPSGKIFRMRGKGLPHVNSSGSGDQLVRVEVWVPGRVSGEEKKALKAMGEAIDAKVPGPHKIEAEEEE
jgi:molecular chaperone DnaJ